MKTMVAFSLLLLHQVRVYVLKGQALQPTGTKHGCDPYLKVKLGKTVIDDRKAHLTDTRDPMFHRAFELPVLFPGVSTLEVGYPGWQTGTGPWLMAGVSAAAVVQHVYRRLRFGIMTRSRLTTSLGPPPLVRAW